MRRAETSKQVLRANWAVVLVLTILAIAGWGQTEALLTILPYAWGELAACNGFYFWKARHENRAKYAQKFAREFVEEHREKLSMEDACRIMEIVLRE